MKYIENDSHNPCFNLALEEVVFTRLKDDETVLLWQNDNTVVVGKNQNTAEEINVLAVKELGARVVRRITGGGAVYHDLGNLNFSFITDWRRESGVSYERFLNPVVDGLKTLGVNARISGRNDLVAAGGKISGNAQALAAGRILHHGTILISADLNMISRVLNVDADKIKSKGLKSVRSRVTNINDCLERPVSVAQVKRALLEAFAQSGRLETHALSPEDLADIQTLAKEKYESWEWNYGKSPEYQLKNTRRFTGGKVSVEMNVIKGVVSACKIRGDFMALLPADELENNLCGAAHSAAGITQALAGMDLKLYVGGISLEELLLCFGC